MTSEHSDTVVNMTQPAKAKPKRNRKGLIGRPPSKATKVEWVSADFILPAVKRLDTTQGALADIIGLSKSAVHNYVHQGKCPKWFRAAVNGLLSEIALPDGPRGEKRNLPALIDPTPDHTTFYIRVPKDQAASARALLGSLGWAIIAQGDE